MIAKVVDGEFTAMEQQLVSEKLAILKIVAESNAAIVARLDNIPPGRVFNFGDHLTVNGNLSLGHESTANFGSKKKR